MTRPPDSVLPTSPGPRSSPWLLEIAELSTTLQPAALLDDEGCLVQANRAWRALLHDDEAGELMRAEPGENYPEFCAARSGENGLAVSRGVVAVLAESTPSFELVYRWHSLSSVRWFQFVARRTSTGRGAIVSHRDVTDSHLAHARLNIHMSISRAFISQMGMLAACRQVAVRVCEELDWDYAGIWTPDAASGTLKCVDAWVRPGQNLARFEAASRGASLGPGVGLPGRAWDEARVQWATELDPSPSTSVSQVPRVMPPSSIAAGLRSALAFPLKCGDDVLAVVDLFSRVRRAPDRALMDLLEVAGDQLALWELRERAERSARAAQANADEARSELESVLDCAPAFVMALDKSGSVQVINKAQPPFRLPSSLGAHWTSHVAPHAHEPVGRALALVLDTGAPQAYQLSGVETDGKAYWFSSFMGPMRSGDSITGAVLIAQDVTASRLAALELADAQRLAAVGTLAAGVAHEINTPVQFVSDSVHFLRDAIGDVLRLVASLREVQRLAGERAPDAAMRSALAAAAEAEAAADLDYLVEHVPKAFDRSLDGLERVATIVRSMKEFAHPAQKEMAPADLNRAIIATLTVAQNEYKYVADITLDLAADLPPLMCHINDINQAVLNVVVNAAHAIADVVQGSERRGAITVRTWFHGPDVFVSIRDTGGGIPEAVQSRVFEPFFTTKQVGRGTGQGLAIARSAIVDKHSGEITFETEPGVGTVFFLRLPIAGHSRGEHES